jgi:hypothetical protein
MFFYNSYALALQLLHSDIYSTGIILVHSKSNPTHVTTQTFSKGECISTPMAWLGHGRTKKDVLFIPT